MDGDAGTGGESATGETSAATATGEEAPEATGPATRADPAGHAPATVDYGWVMQVTFVVTIVVGAPLVAALSLKAALPTWEDKAGFAVRVGAAIWLVTALAVYAHARSRR